MTTEQLNNLLLAFLSAVANGETGMTVKDLLSEVELTSACIRRVRTFDEACVMSSNTGLVVTDGCCGEVQIRLGRCPKRQRLLA